MSTHQIGLDERIPTADPPVPESLDERLSRERADREVLRQDQIARRRADLANEITDGDLVEERSVVASERRIRTSRREQVAQLREAYMEARIAGSRARIQAEMGRSAEVRALRLERLGRWVLMIGIPVLVGFGVWSTAGVQAGVDRLLGLESWSAYWVASWGVEAALITFAAGLIIFEAIIRLCGGEVSWWVHAGEAGALSLSIMLNLAGMERVDWSRPGELAVHSIGPLGAAGTAFMIGVLMQCIARTDPWSTAPSIADMEFDLADVAGEFADPFARAIQTVGQTADPSARPDGQTDARPDGLVGPDGDRTDDGLPQTDARPDGPSAYTDDRTDGDRTARPSAYTDDRTARPSGADGSDRTATGRGGRTGNRSRSDRPVRDRSDTGVPVPPSARPPAVRPLSDDELDAKLDRLYATGRLSDESSLTAVRTALGCGMARARKAVDRRTARPSGADGSDRTAPDGSTGDPRPADQTADRPDRPRLSVIRRDVDADAFEDALEDVAEAAEAAVNE
jgi:hypothetical protein